MLPVYMLKGLHSLLVGPKSYKYGKIHHLKHTIQTSRAFQTCRHPYLFNRYKWWMSHLMGEPMDKWMLSINCLVYSTLLRQVPLNNNTNEKAVVNNSQCARKLKRFDFHSTQIKTSLNSQQGIKVVAICLPRLGKKDRVREWICISFILLKTNQNS